MDAFLMYKKPSLATADREAAETRKRCHLVVVSFKVVVMVVLARAFWCLLGGFHLYFSRCFSGVFLSAAAHHTASRKTTAALVLTEMGFLLRMYRSIIYPAPFSSSLFVYSLLLVAASFCFSFLLACRGLQPRRQQFLLSAVG